MGQLLLLGGIVIIALALVTDASETVKLGIAIITAGGLTFIARRIIQTINKDAADLITFVGWCFVAFPFIKMLKLSTSGFVVWVENIQRFNEGFAKFAAWVDKINFLN